MGAEWNQHIYLDGHHHALDPISTSLRVFSTLILQQFPIIALTSSSITMASSKPAIVIIPGAFYSPWHYRLLHTGLESAGYNVATISLPSTGSTKPEPNMDADVSVAASAIRSYISFGQNVVVAMHSFGGLVGNCGSKGLLPKDTENGKGVVGMVYMCAGVPIEGMSFMDGSGGNHFPWTRLVGEDPQPNSGIFMFCDNNGADPEKLFFHDCEAEVRAEAVKRLQYWSEGCLWSKATFAAWKEVESHYLICTDDQSGLSVEMQEMMTKMGDAGGSGKWKFVEKVEASHSPFLSKPEETIRFVRKCCGEEV